MSIRKGKTIIAGNAVSSDWTGTLEEYNIALKNGTIKENWVCYITDDEQGYISSKYGSDIALLDIIVSNQLLEGKDLIGKVLQGSMVLGSEYPDAYNKLLTNKNKSASTQVTETIGGIELTYTQCAIGYKILDISNKDKYDQLFEATGTSNFFVLDETNKLFYLPKTNNFLQPNTSVGKIGDYNEAGLPNIEGSARRIACTTEMETDGALSFETDGTNNTTAGASLSAKINFDASKSNPIYGNSPTVQPQSTNVFIYYKVGNTIQTDASIDLEAQVLNLQQRNNIPFSLLESKYSETPLNNTSWLLSNGQWNDGTIYEAVYDRLINLQENTQESISVKLHTDSYTDYDFVLNLEDETFRLPLLNGSESIPSDKYIDLSSELTSSGQTFIAPANGWYTITMSRYGGETQSFIAISNLTTGMANEPRSYGGGSSTTFALAAWIYAKRGDIIKVSYSNVYAFMNNDNGFIFNYAQGNGSLYYYVGETNTDINIINTGKLAEKYSKDIDNKLDKSQITNCLLEVPQNIKLELNEGILTLKAGSTVIVPNGVGVFDEVETSEDLTITYTGSASGEGLLFYDTSSSNIKLRWLSNQVGSGTSVPTSSYWLYYNTDENKVYNIDNGVSTQASFPVGVFEVASSGSGITSINQVFNGMGYIGSTIWVDKGVKGLIPNGRNEDGTLNNIEVITDKVSIRNVAEGDKNISITISTDSIVGDYFSLINTDTPPAQTYKLYYKEKENELWNTYNNSPARFFAFVCANATMTISEGITSFNPKTTFRAVDYNDFANTPHITETYVNGTSWYRIYSDGWCEQGGVFQPTSSTLNTSGSNVTLLKPYKNTDFSIVISQKSNRGEAVNAVCFGYVVSNSVISMCYYGNTSTNSILQWYACGYIN